MTTDSSDIELSGPFKATDGNGQTHDVKAIRIFDEGYGIIDVYVDFAKPIDAGLYKDKVLVKQIIDRLRDLRASRPQPQVDAALSALESAARSGDNLMPPILEAAKSLATVGEIATALRHVFGEHR